MMTEEQKKLKERFLEPETRCGHYVSAEAKACWKVMLDILEEVDRICRKHNLKYFLIAGSLLGAIRHKGFIPWDDDVDIALFREDYDRLEQILPKELPSHMFMQTLATDNAYTTAHIKIRYAGTAAIQKGAIKRHACCNMGIFIDIFALDGIPKSRIRRTAALKLAERLSACARYHSGAWKKTKIWKWGNKILYGAIWGLLGPNIVHKLRERCFARVCECEDDECVQNPCSWGYEQRYRYKAIDFAQTRDVPFEYLNLMVPVNSEKILTDTYGDWHQFVKGSSAHRIVYMSPTTDYKAVLMEKFGYSAKMVAKCPPLHS